MINPNLDQFLQDIEDFGDRINELADEPDTGRIAEMAACIRQHNWDRANALIAQWSVQDEPDWADIPDPFNGGYSYVN